MSNALRVAHGEFGRVALLDMDRHLVRHAHPHCHVLLKVEGADTHFSVRNDLAPLTDRSAVLINAWEPHAYVHDPLRPRTVILALYIEPSWLRGFRPNWAASGAPGFFEQAVGDVSPRIRQLTHDLAFSMVRVPDGRAAHEALLAELMIAVIERFTPWRSVSVSLRGLAEHGIGDHRVRRAIETMRACPGAVTDMTSLARVAGLSRAQFFRAFERSARVPPRLYLNMLRLEMAVSAAVAGQDTFATVSDRLGFAAPAHFTRFFRDHAGATPSEFRNVAGLTRAAA
ncbi:AraC family transcriptional regulator [Enterovirga sp.]|uniref:helix-turn-helix transcriptional regulator n=1 Tax=Enterovirga sp. TaxID=2026350 RepID=UPI0026079FC2|nr:AraC family transcriptional regulator [Enterovirga sp.]MDB5590152.1 AraC family transcriptional regulator [Enterovirga sp.]